MDCHDVYYQKKKVGKVYLKPEGRYCTLRCECAIAAKEIHKLMAYARNGTICFGTLFPKDSGLYLERNIPMNTLKDITGYFIERQRNQSFIRVTNEESFPAIERINKMHFANRFPESGVIIVEDPM